LAFVLGPALLCPKKTILLEPTVIWARRFSCRLHHFITMDAWLHHFGLLPHESVAGDLFEWARAWAWTAVVECRGCAYCDDSGEESRGTKRGREEIEIEDEPDETGSLEADDGSQPTKRAKMDQPPVLNAYEQQRLARIRENDQARRLPNSRLHSRAPVLRTRPRYRCAAFVAGPRPPEGRRNPCQDAGCSASACAQEAVRWA